MRKVIIMENKFELVADVLNKLRLAMESDGGGIDHFEVYEMGIVTIKFKGACTHCPSKNLTLKIGIEKTLKKELPWGVRVKALNLMMNSNKHRNKKKDEI